MASIFHTTYPIHPKFGVSSILLLLLLLIGTSCEEDTPQVPEGPNLLEVIQNRSDLTILNEAITQSNFGPTLQSGQYTFFAPSDEAFEAYFSANGISSISDITSSNISRLLLNHTVQSELRESQLIDGYQNTLLLGGGSGNSVRIFFNLGSGFGINNEATIDESDIEATNGFVHIVNEVIPLPDVVDHITYNPTFTTFLEGIQRSDLSFNFMDTLRSDGPFTLFIPTNEAFESFFAANSSGDDIQSLPSDELEDLLRYHILRGVNRFSSFQEETFTSETWLEGMPINVAFFEDVGFLVDLKQRVYDIELVNIQGTNGVIHIIDKVLVVDE